MGWIFSVLLSGVGNVGSFLNRSHNLHLLMPIFCSKAAFKVVPKQLNNISSSYRHGVCAEAVKKNAE